MPPAASIVSLKRSMIMIYFQNANVEIFEYDPNTLGITIRKSAYKARKLNKLLNYYPKGTIFLDEDEPLFTYPKQNNYIRLETALGLKNDLSKAINDG